MKMRRQFWLTFLIVCWFGLAVFGGERTRLVKRAGLAARAAANPYEGNPEEAKAGAKLFRQHCASCHGENAQGIGKAPPLISGEVRNAEPGALFWVLRNGSRPTGMPSFSKLPEQQRWQIIAWLKTASIESKH